MKKLTTILLTGIAALIVGCASTPKSWERTFYDITTNQVPFIAVQTNHVTITNEETRIAWVTNHVTDSQVEVIQVTNHVQIPVVSNYTVLVTNYIPAYDYAPKTNVTVAVTAAKDVAGTVAGPWGSFAGGLVLGLIALYGKLRSSNQTSMALAQAIETGREILKTAPNGDKLDDAYVAWMKDHQREIGVLRAILPLVDNVNNDAAKGIAMQIRNALDQAPKA